MLARKLAKLYATMQTCKKLARNLQEKFHFDLLQDNLHFYFPVATEMQEKFQSRLTIHTTYTHHTFYTPNIPKTLQKPTKSAFLPTKYTYFLTFQSPHTIHHTAPKPHIYPNFSPIFPTKPQQKPYTETHYEKPLFHTLFHTLFNTFSTYSPQVSHILSHIST